MKLLILGIFLMFLPKTASAISYTDIDVHYISAMVSTLSISGKLDFGLVPIPATAVSATAFPTVNVTGTAPYKVYISSGGTGASAPVYNTTNKTWTVTYGTGNSLQTLVFTNSRNRAWGTTDTHPLTSSDSFQIYGTLSLGSSVVPANTVRTITVTATY